MRKKGISSLVFLIPLAVGMMFVIGVIVYKLYSDQSATRSNAMEEPKESVTLDTSVSAPSQGYGDIVVPTSASMTLPVGGSLKTDITKELEDTAGDDGSSDMTSFEKDLGGL